MIIDESNGYRRISTFTYSWLEPVVTLMSSINLETRLVCEKNVFL